jgi:aspartyl-tRNA(Asn)/glutamyl-tRNA(Gln) amidotransferase subunit C
VAAVIDLDTVRHVARLARLHLEPDELERMGSELSGILEHIEYIQSLDLDDAPGTTHVVALQNVLGEDVPGPELTPEEALREAPEADGGAFAVPRMG